MIKACIFDMDGTTVNTINSIAYFANTALKNIGLPPIETDVYKRLVGNGARVLARRMLAEAGGREEVLEKLLEDYNTTYDNDFLYLTEPYDGICELLSQLKASGIKTGILSNKPHSTAVKVSQALFGDKLIDICLGGRAGIALKPDPCGVFEIMRKFGAEREECIYIGDTATDMQTGKNSGLYTIGVLWGFRDREELEKSGADVIVSRPEEILNIVKQRQ